jgi:hypothetical protein
MHQDSRIIKTGNADVCSIDEVLRHPYVERLSRQILTHGSSYQSFLVVPDFRAGISGPAQRGEEGSGRGDNGRF